MTQPKLLQDECRELSRKLSNTPDAMTHAREAAQLIQQGAMMQPGIKAVTDVLAERQRQIAVEGWTPEHDDEHIACELSDAAACYALGREAADAGDVPDCWPQSWDESWWRPSLDRRRNLVKAAALLLAEIERLDRARGL